MSDWYSITVDDTLQKLDTSREGLPSEESEKRLDAYGPNELRGKGTRAWWRILLEQFVQTMVIVLLVAAIVSVLIGDWLEAGAILAIVVLFAALGFVQNYRADRAMAALREMAVPEVDVLRDGREKRISGKCLVPGDIVFLKAGNLVPADLRIMETVDLKVDESALTGESEAVSKQSDPIDLADPAPGDRVNMAYNGTVISSGRGKGVVTQTGMNTEMGSIASMIQAKEEKETPMQRELDRVSKVLAAAGIGVAILVGLIGYSVLDQSMKEMFLVAVSLAVAVVPEGLPAVVTLTLSLGSQRMLRRNTLIRKLPAVETLGSVTVICTDKTGTLTRNRMTVTEVLTLDDRVDLTGFDKPPTPIPTDHDPGRLAQLPEGPALLIACGALCNDAELEWDKENQQVQPVGDATEGALRLAAIRVGLSDQRLQEQIPRTNEIPFSSERKRMTTFHRISDGAADLPETLRVPLSDGQEYLAITKGAPDLLLDIADRVWTKRGPKDMDDEMRAHIQDQHQAMAEKGMRVLALGVRFPDAVPSHMDESAEQDICFVGLFGLMDPPRPEVKEAVKKCKTAGIRPVMITGDHAATASSIARDLGIADNERVLSGKELNQISTEELAEAVKDISVFARVSPEHKLKIVDAFQADGEICSMTGDGVNDAPALKSADIGVAMGITGTEVAKEAADMVLLDDNYATIEAAVEEGRVIGDNVRRFVKYSIAGNTGKVIVMMFAPLFGIPLALLPLQLLWLNLITDGLLGLGMSVEPPDKNTMNRPPRAPDEGVFSRGGVLQVLVIGAVIGAVSLGVGAWYFHHDGARSWQSIIFTLIAFLQVGQALAMRSDRESFFSLEFLANPLLVGICVGVVFLQLALLYVPLFHTFLKIVVLTPMQLGVCAAFGSAAFIVVEGLKMLQRRKG